jgi:hypothetical protein
MLKVYFFIFCFFVGLALHAQDRIELGVQTTRRGVVWHRPGMPTHAPQWRPSRDTNAVFWVDTLTSLRYHWDYLRDVWRTYGTTKTALPLPAQQVSGAAIIDNTTATWIRDTFNLLHKYDSTCSAWTPTGDFFVSASVPTDISASPTNGAAIYTRSLWQRSTDYEVHYWDGAVWQPFDSGGTDTSGYNLDFSISGDTLYLTDGDGTLFVPLPPATVNTDTSGYNLDFSISGDTLYLTDGDGTLFVDLSGINTDNQKVDTFSIVGNVVYLSIEGDGEPAKTIALPTPDGSETIVTAGDLITVTGTGTSVDPYIVSSTFGSLPYHLNDEDALANGLFTGNSYLLSPGNTFAMPSGMYKVVVGCGYDCAALILFFPSDGQASANGVPAGRQYATSTSNVYGITYGFVKVVGGVLASDTLQCSAALPDYANDSLAIVGGLSEGEHYAVTDGNPYGAPDGAERVVSTASTTEADAGLCCEENETFQSYDNDAAAISGGLTTDDHYKLSASNTYGWPTGAKKIVR